MCIYTTSDGPGTKLCDRTIYQFQSPLKDVSVIAGVVFIVLDKFLPEVLASLLHLEIRINPVSNPDVSDGVEYLTMTMTVDTLHRE